MLSDNGTPPAMEIKEIINRQNAKFTNQRVPVKQFDIPDQSFSVGDFIFQRIKNITIEFGHFLTIAGSNEEDNIYSPFI